MLVNISRTAKHPLALAVVFAISLSGCARLSESRVNPTNWFDFERSEQLPPLVEDVVEVEDQRPLVSNVTQLEIDPAIGGAIIRAVGLPATQGFYDAELVLVEDPDTIGVLTYEFRIIPPRQAKPAGSAPSREVIVAKFVSRQDLAGVRTIRVLGSSSARSVRR